MTKAWLASFSWEWVTNLNSQLCESGSAFHGPTSDGHEEARALWAAEYTRSMSIAEAVELCRRCHKTAPFCFFNGNTFATIIKLALREMPEPAPMRKHLFLTITAHMVAGTATPEEEIEFKKVVQKIA